MNISGWKTYKIGDLFALVNGIKYPSYDREPGSLPLVSTSDQNNGISDYIADRPEKFKNLLTVAYSGSVGATFYHDNYVFVGETVFGLLPKFNLNKNIGLFLCSILRKHNEVYTYGRKIIGSRYIYDTIKLPSLANGEPDWNYMDKYIDSILKKKDNEKKSIEGSLKTVNTSSNQSTIKFEKWKEFKVGSIFSCDTTKAISYDEIIPGNTLYVTRSSLNNGCSGFISNVPNKLEKGNCITIGAEGKVAFYQPTDFLPGVKVYTLRNPKLNKNIGMFIVTILNKNIYKYSYGRARILSNIANENIMLPADLNGDPDWDYMNNFVSKMPYADRI